MNATTNTGAPGDGDWWTPHHAPVAITVASEQMRDLSHTLRRVLADHDDVAWVHPSMPTGTADGFADLGAVILDAIGAVGRSQPRTMGERHLLRPLTHLIHGDVRHLFITDAALLSLDIHLELHQAAQVAGVQLWLLIDPADGTSEDPTQRLTQLAPLLAWVHATCPQLSARQAIELWRGRPPTQCRMPDTSWWFDELDPVAAWPPGCGTHTRVGCLLTWGRRSLTAGATTPDVIRRRLNEFDNHADTTVEDHWHLAAAGRNFYEAGTDALRLTGADAGLTTIGDVATDGSWVLVEGEVAPVPALLRPAIARLRTSRHLAGCLDTEPIAGLFDKLPGSRRPRPRR